MRSVRAIAPDGEIEHADFRRIGNTPALIFRGNGRISQKRDSSRQRGRLGSRIAVSRALYALRNRWRAIAASFRRFRKNGSWVFPVQPPAKSQNGLNRYPAHRNCAA